MKDRKGLQKVWAQNAHGLPFEGFGSMKRVSSFWALVSSLPTPPSRGLGLGAAERETVLTRGRGTQRNASCGYDLPHPHSSLFAAVHRNEMQSPSQPLPPAPGRLLRPFLSWTICTAFKGPVTVQPSRSASTLHCPVMLHELGAPCVLEIPKLVDDRSCQHFD